MLITSKAIHELGFKYNWINKHFKHLALDYYYLSGHAQYNIFNVSDLVTAIEKYKTPCKNPIQVKKSYDMMNKLKGELDEYNARNV